MRKLLLSPFTDSFGELKKLNTITILGMLTALNVILYLFFSIKISDSLRISFSYLTIALSGYLFGPVGAGIAGVASDLINCIVKPIGPYFIGYTISALVTGVIYGLMLYKKTPSIKRVIIAKLLVLVIVELTLNTLWPLILFGTASFAWFPAKLVKSLISFPIEVFMLYFVVKFAVTFKKRAMR